MMCKTSIRDSRANDREQETIFFCRDGNEWQRYPHRQMAFGDTVFRTRALVAQAVAGAAVAGATQQAFKKYCAYVRKRTERRGVVGDD